jgi:branched-chain amino acid transport system ATP-binding protein
MLKGVHLTSGYGSLQVLRGVSVHAGEGEIVALVGTNGSGKSTLLKTLAGLINPAEGRLFYRGRDVSRWPAERLALEGVALVPEGRGLFPEMSVLDNLKMGLYGRKCGAGEWKNRLEKVCGDFPIVGEKLGQRAGSLSGGQQQSLALARALIGEPRVLLLDEPSTGLAPKLAAEIFTLILKLKAEGKTIILAEQHVREALRAADRAYVMKTGRIVLDGPASQLLESDEIKKAYLGA